MKHIQAALVVCLLSGSFAGAADWSQFRGPGGKGISEETGLPIHWSKTENVRWQAELPGRGVSCPVVAGNRVYLTACTGVSEDRLHVLCFDLATGKRLWQRQFWATGSTVCNAKTCMAAATPVTDGERVYALFATGDLVCLDSAGNLVWYRSLERDYPTIGNHVGMAASPVLWNNVLLLPMENPGESFAAGLDKLTGQNLWKQERSRDINWVTPQVIGNGGKEEVLFQSRDELTSYDPENGARKWSYKAAGLANVASPVQADGSLLVRGAGLLALRPGAPNTAPEILWQSNKLDTGYTTPVYYQGRIYAVNSVGVLNCADPATGKILWQQRAKGGSYWASPVIAEGRVYLVNEDGTTTVMQTGAAPQVLSVNELGESMLATPAIAGGAILLRSDQHLFCIGAGK